MQLEYHFFAAQGQETAEDDRPGHVAHTDAIGGESTGSTARVVDTEGRGRFRGVHERVALFCVDFDDTLTDGDTTGLLVETAKAQVRSSVCTFRSRAFQNHRGCRCCIALVTLCKFL